MRPPRITPPHNARALGTQAFARRPAPATALERWNARLRAAVGAEGTIEILDVIGEDPFTGGGFTAAKATAALRALGDRDVTIAMNSPGGSVFEGIAIYNILREHKGSVTVKILGLAASAASLVAMAGDRIEIASSGFVMVHNAWGVTVGDANDDRASAAVKDQIDASMAEIYAARTGNPVAAVAAMMDAETWLAGPDAVDMGFADALLPSDAVAEDMAASMKSPREVEAILRRAGLPRAAAAKITNGGFQALAARDDDDFGAVAEIIRNQTAELKKGIVR